MLSFLLKLCVCVCLDRATSTRRCSFTVAITVQLYQVRLLTTCSWLISSPQQLIWCFVECRYFTGDVVWKHAWSCPVMKITRSSKVSIKYTWRFISSANATCKQTTQTDPLGCVVTSACIFCAFSMARSFQKNFVLVSGPTHGGAWRLLCSWDFSVVNEKAIQNHKNNLGIQLKVRSSRIV